MGEAGKSTTAQTVQMLEIRWHGRGGQGAKTAAQILAEAAMASGSYIQAFPEYGPERAGAPIKAYTRISPNPITIHSGIVNPDVVVVIDSTLLETVEVTEGLEEGLLLVNTARPPGELAGAVGRPGLRVGTVDGTAIALDTLGLPMPNLPMLGALLKLTSVVALENLEESIRHKFEKKIGGEKTRANIEAVRRAFQEVKAQ